MFREEIIQTEEELIIKVSAEKIRKHSFEKKEVYRKNINSLIPDEIKNNIELVSSPSKLVSNYKDENFTQTGTWKYRIKKAVPESSTSTQKKLTPTRRKSSRRRKTHETKWRWDKENQLFRIKKLERMPS